MTQAHVKPGVLPLSLSDHYFVHTVVGRARPMKPSKSKHRTVEVRNFNQHDPLCFNNNIMNLNLHHAVNKLNVNKIDKACKQWAEAVLGVMNKHAPLREYCMKNRTNP